MRRQALDSSSLRSAGYDPATEVLEVEFASGAVYRYLGVPLDLWRDFAEAPSKGAFLNVMIKPAYRYRKVR